MAFIHWYLKDYYQILHSIIDLLKCLCHIYRRRYHLFRDGNWNRLFYVLATLSDHKRLRWSRVSPWRGFEKMIELLRSCHLSLRNDLQTSRLTRSTLRASFLLREITHSWVNFSIFFAIPCFDIQLLHFAHAGCVGNANPWCYLKGSLAATAPHDCVGTMPQVNTGLFVLQHADLQAWV